MPLIVITGYPCSGKSFRTRQLEAGFVEKIKQLSDGQLPGIGKVTVICLPSYHQSIAQTGKDSTHASCDDIYNSVALEKTARAYEISAIKRALSKNVIVIADDLNYIKGFRYQLWCEAKAAGTRSCTVHCAAREDEVETWNRERLKKWAEMNGEAVEQEDIEPSTAAKPVGNGDDRLPESHTALYGDRVFIKQPRSRSSSMGADDGEDDVDSVQPNLDIDGPLRSLSLAQNGPEQATDLELSSLDEGDTKAIPELSKSSSHPTPNFPSPNLKPYSRKTLHSLLMRYEPPSPFSKWDTPLFTIPASDPAPPISFIWDAIFPPRNASSFRKGGASELKSEVQPHAATILPQTTEADALQLLERTTADIISQIIAHGKARPDLGDQGGEMVVTLGDASEKSEETLSIPMGTVLSLPMLQRLKRRFIQIQRGGIAHGKGHIRGEKAIGSAFVRFLDGEMGR